MKTILFLTAALISFSAEAKSSKADNLQVIYSEIPKDNTYFDDKGSCRGWGERIVSNLYNNVFTPTFRADMEYQCSKVFIDVRIVSDGSYSLFDGASYVMSYVLTVSCEPRSLRDKQILSLVRTCEAAPTPECYSDAFLNKIGKLAPTSYKTNHTGPCK